jgi:hypothetical protein
MAKVSYIDFEKRIIVGKKGTVYNIQPERISSKLWAEYQIRGALLGSGMSFENYAKGMVDINNHLRHGKENAQGNTANALTVLDQMIDSAERFKDSNYNEQVEFCSIFCKTENEPVDINDEATNKRKFDDWGEIPQPFFLTLIELSIIMYKKSSEALKERARKEVELGYNP